MFSHLEPSRLKQNSTCQSSGGAPALFFNNNEKPMVDYWACYLEGHEQTSGTHYHVCIRLSGPERWNPVTKLMRERYEKL